MRLLYTLMCVNMTAGYGRGLPGTFLKWGGGVRLTVRSFARMRKIRAKYAQNPVDSSARADKCLLQLQFDSRQERSRAAVAEIL